MHEPSGSTALPSLGHKLATLRAERRLTLREVALGCGLAESFLSKLERDKVNISVGNLAKIAAFFRVSISYFFEAPSSTLHATVMHTSDYPLITRTNSAVRISTLLPRQHSLDAVLVETPPGEHESAHHQLCGGDEFTYLIQGHLRYWVANEEYSLVAGDTITHRSDLDHHWENTGNDVAVAINVCLPGPTKLASKPSDSRTSSMVELSGLEGHKN